MCIPPGHRRRYDDFVVDTPLARSCPIKIGGRWAISVRNVLRSCQHYSRCVCRGCEFQACGHQRDSCRVVRRSALPTYTPSAKELNTAILHNAWKGKGGSGDDVEIRANTRLGSNVCVDLHGTTTSAKLHGRTLELELRHMEQLYLFCVFRVFALHHLACNLVVVVVVVRMGRFGKMYNE